MEENVHFSDEVLLLAADGELSLQREAQLLAHLVDCTPCAARMAKLKDVAASTVYAYQAGQVSPLTPVARSRAALKSRLAALGAETEFAGWRPLVANLFAGPRWAYVLAIIFVATLGVRLQQMSPREEQARSAQSAAGPLLPEPRLTPGVTRPISVGEACKAGPPDQMATISASLRQAVFHEYGMDPSHARQYEVDHLITPELGGTDDIRNLWPEPYSSTEWNAYVKDELEDHLRQLVCDGKIDLSTAQRDIATDWIAAYRKYFHTDKPLSNVSRLAWN
jgi:hypothetical protein